MHRPLTAHFLLMMLFLAGCGRSGPDPGHALGPDAWLPMKIGDVTFEAQIAIKEAEQRKGLMRRDSLPENAGMLFPYPSPRRLSFWMANTRIPLDIGYFDSGGMLREVHRMVPFDTTPTASRGDDLQFALEMNRGWFAANGIYPGHRLDMKLLEEAILRRGADPGTYGINAGKR